MISMSRSVLNRTHFMLLLCLLILLSNIIYNIPRLGYSPVPTQWGPGSAWGRNYIVENGALPESVNSITWFSNIRNYSTIEVYPKILAAIINIVTGTVEFPLSEHFHSCFSWVALVFLPVVVLYFYSKIAKANNSNINYFDCVLLYLLAVFPLSGTLHSMSLGAGAANSVARVTFLLILVIIALALSNRERPRTLVCLLTLLLLFFGYHHTWSYYLLIILGVMFIYSFLSGLFLNRVNNSFRSIFTIAYISFIATTLYINNSNSLKELNRIIDNFDTRIELGNFLTFRSVSPSVNSSYIFYETGSSVYSILQIISCLLLLSICLIFVYISWSSNKKSPYAMTLNCYLISVFFIMVALFVWDGVPGVIGRI